MVVVMYAARSDYKQLKEDPAYQLVLNAKIPVMTMWDVCTPYTAALIGTCSVLAFFGFCFSFLCDYASQSQHRIDEVRLTLLLGPRFRRQQHREAVPQEGTEQAALPRLLRRAR